jgi:hypothetical protein
MAQLTNTAVYGAAQDDGESLWRDLSLSHIALAAGLIAVAALSAAVPDVATYLAMMG